MTGWTDERVERLRALRREGKSYTAMAAELGTSRSAISGKLLRLDAGDPLVTRTNPPRPKRQPTPKVTAALVELPSASGVRLLDLTSRCCRWPLGGPLERAEFFCGAAPMKGKPYCAEHRARSLAATSRPADAEATQ